MNSQFSDWKELRNILVIVILCMIVVGFLDVTGIDVPPYAVLTGAFVVGVFAVVTRQHHSL